MIGETLYFIASESPLSNNRKSIWRSDGTEGATLRLADNPAQLPAAAQMFIGHNDDYLLVAQSDEQHSLEPHAVPLPSVTAPPGVLAAGFDDQTAPLKLIVYFSKDVSASLAQDDLTILNRANNQPIAISTTFAYDRQTNAATWTITSPLADGHYRATLAAASITDSAGAPLTHDLAFDFVRLAADTNRDRIVDFADLVVLAQHYNTPTGMTRRQGDVSGDGAVNYDDLVLLAQSYNTNLTELPPSAASTASTASTASPASATPAVFSDTPIRTKRPARATVQRRVKVIP